MKISRFACLVALGAVTLAGCASTGEQEFGSSVRHMMTGQSYNPAAPANNAVGGTDGEKAGIAVKEYRADKKQTGSAASVLVLPVSQ